MNFISHSLAETENFARDFVKKLTGGGRIKVAAVVGLYGDLGSGKTTLAQAVGRALGVTDSIQSPTFVIEKKYKTSNPIYGYLVHVDAYRLSGGEELRKLGFEELLADSNNLILVEWADRVADVLPPDHIKLHFKFVDENTREFSISSMPQII
jgi:tRNA threonylcarbamoyladenosine biosynthesis protein TsaE